MKIYNEHMNNFDIAMVAMLNDDEWMFAYSCDQMKKDGNYEQLDIAKRLHAAKIEADFESCPF